MQGIRRPVDAPIGNQFIVEHLVVDLRIDEMRKQTAAGQNMVEHLRSAMMQYGKAPIGRNRPLHRNQDIPRQMT
jgi:hypothetical protein